MSRRDQNPSPLVPRPPVSEARAASKRKSSQLGSSNGTNYSSSVMSAAAYSEPLQHLFGRAARPLQPSPDLDFFFSINILVRIKRHGDVFQRREFVLRCFLCQRNRDGTLVQQARRSSFPLSDTMLCPFCGHGASRRHCRQM